MGLHGHGHGPVLLMGVVMDGAAKYTPATMWESVRSSCLSQGGADRPALTVSIRSGRLKSKGIVESLPLEVCCALRPVPTGSYPLSRASGVPLPCQRSPELCGPGSPGVKRHRRQTSRLPPGSVAVELPPGVLENAGGFGVFGKKCSSSAGATGRRSATGRWAIGHAKEDR